MGSAERRDGSDQLDINVRENRYITEFSLKGKLYGNAVRRLERLWIEHIETGGVLLLDVRGLTHIDAAGRKMLFFMQQEGVQILVGADESEAHSTALSPVAWPEARN
ncbi:MAG: STAS domain-containing protein [Acidobacteriia bacterium]|nr:STAS domain-containing protein [Terriglobia bacterium]